MDVDIIQVKTYAKLRGPDSDFIYIADNDFTEDKLIEMRWWSENIMNGKYMWVVVETKKPIKPHVDIDENLDALFSL